MVFQRPANLFGMRFERQRPIIPGTKFVYLAEGAHGVILADTSKGRVRKIFFSQPSESGRPSARMFCSEVRAYEIAMMRPRLQGLVPKFFGRCPTGTILDEHGINISDEFVPGLAFEAEMINLAFVKIGTIDANERKRVVDLFAGEGISYLEDASVAMDGNLVVKVIDFAIEGFEVQHLD